MKSILKALAIILFVGFSSVGAHAQEATATQIQNPYSLRIGSMWPTSSIARRNESYSPLSIGGDYAIAETSNVPPAFTSVYLDYAGGATNGGQLYFYALGVELRTYPDTNNGNTSAGVSNNVAQQTYYGAGVGAYHTYAKDGASGSSGTNTNIGFKAFAGLEFSQRLVLELNYNLIPKADGIDPSGFELQIGSRF